MKLVQRISKLSISERQAEIEFSPNTRQTLGDETWEQMKCEQALNWILNA